jgi:phosphatidylserine/phosphatidylglycerophosphate/cardiolipin synthase-like enzyme
VQAYSFTSTQISKALEDVHARGVAVRVIMDHNAAREAGSVPTALVEHSVPVWTDGQHPIAHNKVMVIDGAIVITGSFNFTRQAENSNAENLLVIRDHPKLAKAYAENFEEHLKHSEKYEGQR